MASTLRARQFVGGQDPNDNYAWWDTTTAIIIKWAVLAAIFVLILLFLAGAYFHANRRLNKGLPPLAYHRWLVRGHRRTQLEPQFASAPPPHDQFSFYQPQPGGYNMYPIPPPAYNPSHPSPPTYQPPVDFCKADLARQYPSAPPPSAGPLAG
ncbi:MAG: hypothetical protein M1838_003190 [Thelocarpon superellum]|nr:MAG: hypothetical protein M1838_003190 [Thelocarpon superellum]